MNPRLAACLVVCLIPLLAVLNHGAFAIGEEDSIYGQMEKLDQRYSELKLRIKKVKTERQQLDLKLKEIGKGIVETRSKLEKQQNLLGGRFKESYKLGRLSAWEYLLASRDFGEFVLRRHYLKKLFETDQKLLDSYRAAAGSILLRQKTVEKHRGEVNVLMAKLAQEEKSLAGQLEEKRAFVEKVKKDVELKKKAEAEKKKATKDLNRRVAKLSKDDAAYKTPFSHRKGGLICPVLGHIELGFGESGAGQARHFHGGWDLRAKAGRSVKSPATGKVAFAGRLRGFGNLIVIDHGEKYHSLYAHLGDMLLSKNTIVDRGQVIGHVGETDSLKGAFLYFELRHKGKPLNPKEWVNCK